MTTVARAQRLAGLLVQLLVAHGASALVPEPMLELLAEELSGKLAKENVIMISRHHRVQASRGYDAAAQWVLSQLQGYGYADAVIEGFDSDGRIRYGSWPSPPGWSIDSAELRLVEPVGRLLVRYPEQPMSVVTLSNPTDTTAELIDVGRGTGDADYEGKDVRGKLVLATGYGGAVHYQAVLERGALGVVCYLEDQRAMHEPDILQYTGMWPIGDEVPRVTFGFNLTPRQGRELKAMLARGDRVVLRALVRGAGIEPGRLEVVSAVLPGTGQPDQELLLIAHLDHPKESANDNASGSGAILDLARGLKALVDSGRLAAPQRSIRFLWVPEFFGTMAYVDAHPELRGPRRGGRVLAALNLDMVGEDHQQLGSTLLIVRGPHSLPSALDDLVESVARLVELRARGSEFLGLHAAAPEPGDRRRPFQYRMQPYAGGSDHVILNDSSIQIPALMLVHDPDATHHTSADTPDQVDPGELERAELIAGAALWTLANLEPTGAVELAGLVAARGAGRLADDGLRAQTLLRGVERERLAQTLATARGLLEHAGQREKAALMSIKRLAPAGAVDALVAELTGALEAAAAGEKRKLEAACRALFGVVPAAGAVPPPDELERRAARLLPIRKVLGPIHQRAFGTESPAAAAALSDAMKHEALNFCDGKRSAAEVQQAVYAEFAPQAVPLEAVVAYLEDLARQGWIDLAQSAAPSRPE